MTRIINDLMEISELAHHGPEDLFISSVMFVGSFLILCTINIPLTLIIFAFIPFIVLFTWKQRNKMHNAFMETRVETSEQLMQHLENCFSRNQNNKSFCISRV